ncbi:MAG: hypothetical protein U5R30_04380 [Deltaproteobacteria bacterium]|nr:hypothetical protein [Deltaproteobacteria bacterium]
MILVGKVTWPMVMISKLGAADFKTMERSTDPALLAITRISLDLRPTCLEWRYAYIPNAFCFTGPPNRPNQLR